MIAVLRLDNKAFPPDGVTLSLEYKVARNSSSFVRLATRADCLLLSCSAPESTDCDAAVEIRRRFPTKPIIVLAKMSPSSIDALAPVLAADAIHVVWHAQLPTVLEEVIEDALADNPLWQLQRFIRDVVRPSPLVAQAVRIVCTAAEPPRSVRELARSIGVAETTLRYHWTRQFRGQGLRELIEWSLFMRGVLAAAASHRASASHVAGVHLRTLQRMAHRLLGCSFREIMGHPDEAFRAFERWAEATFSTGS